MNTFSIVTGYSLELPAISNRLIPIINKALNNKYHVIIYSPSHAQIPDFQEVVEYRCLSRSINNSRSFYLRALHELVSSFLLMREVYKNRHNVLLIGIPSIFLLFFSRPSHYPQILDVRDIAWEYINEKNPLNYFIKRFFRLIGLRKLYNFDKIICTNPSEINYFRHFSEFSSSNIFLVPNGIRKEQFASISALAHKNDSHTVNISYIGNISTAQSLDNFILASKLLPNVNFHIVGDGRDFSRIKHLIASLGLSNCSTYGRLPWSQVLDIYRNTDILFAQLLDGFEFAVPSKLYEYLASGKFIIYSGRGEAVQLLSKFQNNLAIGYPNPEKLASIIQSIISSGQHLKVSDFNKDLIHKNYIREKNVDKLFNKIFDG